LAVSACGQDGPAAANNDSGPGELTGTVSSTDTSTTFFAADAGFVPGLVAPTSTGDNTSVGTGFATGTGSDTGSGKSIPPSFASGPSTAIGGESADGTFSGSAAPVPALAPGGPAPIGVVVGTTTASTTSTSSVVSQATGGKMTAGTWDDNLNFDFYTSYLNATVATQMPGLPLIDRSARMVILVKTASGQPVAGAGVEVTDSAGGNAFTTTTGAEGRVLYFPGWLGIAAGTSVTVTAWASGDDLASKTVVASAGTVELTLAHTGYAPVPALDLAFVVDTTGSMGDELSYLQSELDNIVSGIAAKFPNVNQRWGLVLYRDTGDEYVVRSFDFTSDLTTFRQNLAAQSASGGNDTPEAVDQGLAAANQLSWRTAVGPAARVQFWIADAPHHVGREAAVVSALHDAVVKGVHIYPVAASGIDDLGEFTMRTAAEVTGGRYLFLTDDSGIGNSHAEPHIPCYYVTTLSSAMGRMVATELSGDYVAPTSSEIIRTGGDPQSQLCTLSDGGTVTAW
jgi:hypothetical protein